MYNSTDYQKLDKVSKIIIDMGLCQNRSGLKINIMSSKKEIKKEPSSTFSLEDLYKSPDERKYYYKNTQEIFKEKIDSNAPIFDTPALKPLDSFFELSKTEDLFISMPLISEKSLKGRSLKEITHSQSIFH